MQLNEIIEENTLPTISRKTRISVQNLEALLAKDWSRLKKVQALGFISILEREYHADLSGLRQECRAYFEAHSPAEDEGVSLAASAGASIETGRQKPSKALLVFVILLAAVAGWVLFVSPDESAAESNGSSIEQSGGFYDSVLASAKHWFGGREEESPAEEVPVVKGAWAEENRSGKTEESSSAAKAAGESGKTEKNISLKENAEAKASSEEKAKAEEASGEAKEEAQIIQQVKKEQAKAEEIRQQSAIEQNMSGGGEGDDSLSDISKMILAATAGATVSDQETMEPEVPSLNKEKSKAQKREKSTVPETAEAQEEVQKEKVPEKRGVTETLVIMHPRSKIWVGYTNLRNMKRSAKVTADDLTFDTATGDYILAVGHGQIDFRTRTGEKRLSDGKRHFFMIAKGDVREISHEEFQRLNKSKVW